MRVFCVCLRACVQRKATISQWSHFFFFQIKLVSCHKADYSSLLFALVFEVSHKVTNRRTHQ